MSPRAALKGGAFRSVGIAVCRKDASLLDRINKGLKAVEDEGVIETLMGR